MIIKVQDVKGLACVNCVYLPTWKPCECCIKHNCLGNWIFVESDKVTK